MFSRIGIFATVLFFALQSQALLFEGTFVIPQQTKIQRFGHQTGAAAARSTRRAVGADLSKEETETENNGTKTEDEETTILRPFAYYNFGMGSFELGVAKGDNEEMPVGGPDVKSDTQDISLLGGVVLPDSAFAIGAEYSSEEVDEEAGGTDTEEQTISLTGSMKIGEKFYLGTGISMDETEEDTAGTVVKMKDIHEYFVGFGLINGDSGKPFNAFESTLLWSNEQGVKTYATVNQFVINLSEADELKATLSVVYTSQPGEDTVGEVGGARYDHQFSSMWYIAPEFEYTTLDVGGTDVDGLSFGIEGGIRMSQWDAYARLVHSDSEAEVLGVDIEAEGLSVALGGLYKF